MRLRALVGVITCGLLLTLLLTATRASSMPADSASAGAMMEQWSEFQPSGWTRTTPVTCVVEVYSANGFVNLAQYMYRTGGSPSGWTYIPSEDIVTIDAQHLRLIATNLPLPESSAPDQNQIQFSVKDGLGLDLFSPIYLVRVDTHAPTSIINNSGCYGTDWPGQVSGSASDAVSGVASVEVLLRDGTGRYYDGSVWQSTPTWLHASGTTNWTYAIPDLPQGAYTVQSRATDLAGNVQAVPDQKTFTYDATPPLSAVDIVGCFNRSTWPGAVYGSASDAASGLANVQISLQRVSDGAYYDGSIWVATETWINASWTGNTWSLAFAPSTDSTYLVRSRATDACGNVQSVPGAGSFTYDTSLPQSAVTTAGCFNAASSIWPGAISGTASDAGSPVDLVHVRLQRASDSRYYDGSSWVLNSNTWVTATGVTNWSLAFVPQAETTYTVQSRATDPCGNVQTVLGQNAFSYDITPPVSAVSTAGAFTSWTGAITGTANDAMSGVASVQVNVQRADTHQYYTGSGWVTEPDTWVTALGTSPWSVPFTSPVETTYTVKSKATDLCGNVQTTLVPASFSYDVTAPFSPFGLIVVPSDWSKTNAFTLAWSNPADVSGVAKAHFKWDVAPTNNSDQSPGSPMAGDNIHSLTLAVPVQGTHALYLWLEDAAGNQNYQTRNVTPLFQWDAAAPLTSLVGVNGGQGCTGWYTSTVQVTVSAADVNPDPATINATSGVSATFWRKDGGDPQRVENSTFLVTGEGSHSVGYYSVDVAGNQEGTKVLSPTIKIDTVRPTTNPPSYNGTFRNGWWVSNVSVSLSAMDATSSVSATYYGVDDGVFQLGNSFQITTDGVHIIHYYSVDAACNQEAVQDAQVRIDKTPPTTSSQVDGQAVENGWFLTSPVTVTLSPSDALTGVQTSGVDTLRYRIDGGNWQTRTGAASLVVSGELLHTIEYYANDLAGNVESTHALTVGIDTHAPASIPYTPIVSPSGWTKTNCFTLTWENPQDLSGIGGAYYAFSEPSSGTDGTLVRGDNITSLTCLQVPGPLGEGWHNVYVWLRDGAGNSDYRTRQVVTLRLDQSPPRLTSTVTGTQCGTAGWYNSCITVTFAAADELSGMASGVISYQVNGAGWGTGSSYTVCDDGRYTIEARAMDSALNVGEIVTRLVKLDKTAPLTPTNLLAEPGDWSRENRFNLSWMPPWDLSGVTGAYFKVGNPPVSSTDGTYVEGSLSALTAISVTQQGRNDVYVWLKDKACNADYRNRVVTALSYDSVPPTTSLISTGTLGGDDWYTSPVQITLNCVDSTSGCRSSRYRIGTGPWLDYAPFVLDAEGVNALTFYSTDVAGNIESAHPISVKIDRSPPSSHAYADSYSASTSFTVHWDGNDAFSGIAAFDVQSREGTNGGWQDWIAGAGPLQTSGLFVGARGKTYYFRARARDKAGNQGTYPAVADVGVAVDVLVNGDFERNGMADWGATGPGQCQPTLVVTQSYSGASTHAVVLGCPDVPEGAPVGASMVYQTISVPNAQDMPAPTLRFRYYIRTYDMVWSVRKQKFYDSFNVGFCPVGQIAPTYVFTDGNMTQTWGHRMDLGWREGAVDLRPYAGQRLNVCLANVTREDMLLNTWTLVDDIRVVNQEHWLCLPVVVNAAPVSSMSAAEKQAQRMPLATPKTTPLSPESER